MAGCAREARSYQRAARGGSRHAASGAGLLLLLLLLPPGALAADYYQHQQHQYQGAGPAARAVLLENVKALTLHSGRMTTGRRSAPVLQLRCISGCDFQPEVVQCMNMGSDGSNVQWKCEADLPGTLRFGFTTVTCEGFDYPEDPRILEGSCGLEYSLRRVDGRGKERRGGVPDESKPLTAGVLFKWGVIVYILYMAFRVCRAQGQAGGSRPRPGWGGGWGGGGGGPPPPPPRPPHYDDKMGYGSATAGPNPWLAGAAGMGLGYMMGRRSTAGSNSGSWGNSSFGGGSSDDGPSRTATAYASTSRR